MKTSFSRTALLTACLALRVAAQESASTPPAAPLPPPVTAPVPAADDQKKLEDAIRERLAEHALKKASKAATTTAPDAPATEAPITPDKAATAVPKPEPATQMQRVEVNKSRVTDLAIKLHEKDLEIAREKKNSTPTTLDTTLNPAGLSHTLAVFGGSSDEDRARVSQERVGLLEAEKDLIEEIAQAKTKEEKDELEKTLTDLKAMRRELERAPRDERK